MSSPSLTGQSPNNPTKYLGPNVSLNIVVTRKREPTGADIKQPETGKYYSFGTMWLVGKDPTTGVFGDIWTLSKIVDNVAYWVQSGADFTITTDHTTLQFEQDGNDIVLDFKIANIIMGETPSNITTANKNVGLGADGNMLLLTTGEVNTSVGYGAGGVTSGNNNTLMGHWAGTFVHGGSNNCAFGSEALGSIDGSSNSVAVGYRAGTQLTGGGYNTLIGTLAGVSYIATESNNVTIGALGLAGEHNVIRIGNQGSSTNQQDTCYIAGIINNTVVNQQMVTINSSTGQLGVTTNTFTNAFGTAYVQRTTDHQMLVTNSIVGISNTGAARTVTMPAAGMTVGQQWIVKDESGGAGTNNITITAKILGVGPDIDGAANAVINTNYGAKTLYWNGTAFFTF